MAFTRSPVRSRSGPPPSLAAFVSELRVASHRTRSSRRFPHKRAHDTDRRRVSTEAVRRQSPAKVDYPERRAHAMLKIMRSPVTSIISIPAISLTTIPNITLSPPRPLVCSRIGHDQAETHRLCASQRKLAIPLLLRRDVGPSRPPGRPQRRPLRSHRRRSTLAPRRGRDVRR
jgi:hypothetical protein